MNITALHRPQFANSLALNQLRAQSLNATSSEGSTTSADTLPSDSVSLSAGARSLMEGGGSGSVEGGRVDRLGRDARAVYRRHGETEHSLSDRTEVGRLISRTPQVDNASGTHNDEVRCGGAALTNAMLLDGGYEANARAIRRLAEPAPGEGGRLSARTADGHEPFHMTAAQDEALRAMEAGHLTPNQTAEIQEMMFQMTDGIPEGDAPRESGNDGVTGYQMNEMMDRLTAAGAFPNSREVNMRMDDNGAGGNHWTTTVTTDRGTAHANSWPSSSHRGYDGYAEVTGGNRDDLVYQDGADLGTFTCDVSMRRPNPLLAPRVSAREIVYGDDGRGTVEPF